MALDLCVQPDVVNRHKQVRHASYSFSPVLFSSLWEACLSSHRGPLGADGTDARGDARED